MPEEEIANSMARSLLKNTAQEALRTFLSFKKPTTLGRDSIMRERTGFHV